MNNNCGSERLGGPRLKSKSRASSQRVRRLSQRLTLALLPILLALPRTHWAGINEWTALGPEAGNILSLTVDPQNPTTLYAGSDAIVGSGAQVFKSTDGGSSWNTASSGLPTTAPPGPGSWRRVAALVVDPQTPDTDYAGIQSASSFGVSDAPVVFKTTDGGASWSPASSGLPEHTGVNALAIDPQNPSTLYVQTDWRLFKSADAGVSWIEAGLSTSNAGLLTYYCCFAYVSALAIDPQTPSTLYAAIYGYGVFKSTDGATSWSAANVGFTVLSIGALAIDPQNPNVLYAGTGNYCGCTDDPPGSGVWKSTDGGTSWGTANSGLPSFPPGPYSLGFPAVVSLAIDPLNPSTVYAATQGFGVFKSTDGGTSWSAVNSGLPVSPSGSYRNINALAIDPQNPSTVYAGTADGVFAITFVP